MQFMQSHRGQGQEHGCYAKCMGSQWRDWNLVVTWHYLLLKKIILMVGSMHRQSGP